MFNSLEITNKYAKFHDRIFPTNGAYYGVDLHIIFGGSAEVSGLPESVPQTQTKRIMQQIWASFATGLQGA